MLNPFRTSLFAQRAGISPGPHLGLFSTLSMQTVGPPRELLFVLIGFFVLLAVFSYVAAMKGRPHESTPDRCWKAGIFYVNPEDPSLFVSKRLGIGYTLNFGNPWSWVVLAIILLAAAVPMVLSTMSIHNIHTMRPRP
jgi:Family of unknown function (DUF5808)